MSKNNTIDWNELYNQQAGRLLGTCRRYVRDTQLAQDLVHDGFIKAMENAQNYNGHGAIEDWLKQVVLNNVLEYLRNSKKTSFTDVEDLIIADENEFDQNNDSIISVINSSRFTQEDLLETIDLLPEHHKTVFNLYVIDGYSHKEISDLLNIEQGTSKSHLSRARKKIQQQLVEKASQMKKNNENKKRKKALALLPLLGIGAKANPIDRLFKDAFADYKLQIPNQPAEFKKIINKAKPIKATSKSGFFQSAGNLYWTAGISGAIVIGAITYNILAQKKEVKLNPIVKPHIEKVNPTTNKKDTVVVKTSNIEIKKREASDLNKENALITSTEPVKQTEVNEPTTNVQKTVIEKNKPDTAKQKVVIRKQVVVRKTVVLDENTK